MVHPDDATKPFAARFNALLTALIIEPSVKLVGRQVADYGFMDGEAIYPGNQRLARETGLGEKTIREAFHFLRANGMAHRDARSAWTGTRRTADTYALDIPADWMLMPVLGPHHARFTCQGCGQLFNPQPCNVFLAERHPGRKGFAPVTDPQTGFREVRWALWKAVFCPPPRKQKGKPLPAGCRQQWERANGPWNAGDNKSCWEMFRKARDDDWPPHSFLSAA